jgi:hypothetical protein
LPGPDLYPDGPHVDALGLGQPGGQYYTVVVHPKADQSTRIRIAGVQVNRDPWLALVVTRKLPTMR